MKKILLLLAACAATGLSVNGQTRMTLHEEFTGENCGPCAATNPDFWVLCNGAGNPSKLIHIAYMVPIPSNGWYCSRTSAIHTVRTAYYTVPFAPYGRYDGHVPNPTCGTGGSSAGHPGCFTQADIDAEALIPSEFNMTVTNAWNSTFDSVTATVNITCVAAYSGTLKLRMALVQTNDFLSPPGSNGETHFENVVQAMYPDPAGTTIPGSWTVGMTQTFTVTGPCPNFVDKTGSPSVVAWIQNDVDKYIPQAAQATPLPTIALDAGALTSAGIAKMVCGSGTYSAVHTATLKNTGTTTLTSATIYYKADAGAYSNYAWSGSLAAGASTSVTLPALSVPVTIEGSNHVLIDSVAMPNGTADINPANNVNGVTFFLASTNGLPMPYTTSFEDFDTLYHKTDAGSNGDMWNIWQTGTTGVYLGHTGTYAAGFPFLNYSTGTVNSIVLPEVNITNPAKTALKFWVAYSQTTTANTDKLEVVYSTDCGGSWTSLSTISGATAVTLPASTTAYSYPTSPTQYKSYKVNLTGVTAGPAMLGFRATDGGGNFIFVDDVNIVSTVGVDDVVSSTENISIYPNPAREEATLSFGLTTRSDVQVQIVDGLGRVMNTVANEKMDAGMHTFNINTTNLASGIYNVMIHTDGGMQTVRLTVAK